MTCHAQIGGRMCEEFDVLPTTVFLPGTMSLPALQSLGADLTGETILGETQIWLRNVKESIWLDTAALARCLFPEDNV